MLIETQLVPPEFVCMSVSLSVSSLSFSTCVCLGDLCPCVHACSHGCGHVSMHVCGCMWRREADYWKISSVTLFFIH